MFCFYLELFLQMKNAIYWKYMRNFTLFKSSLWCFFIEHFSDLASVLTPRKYPWYGLAYALYFLKCRYSTKLVKKWKELPDKEFEIHCSEWKALRRTLWMPRWSKWSDCIWLSLNYFSSCKICSSPPTPSHSSPVAAWICRCKCNRWAR